MNTRALLVFLMLTGADVVNGQADTASAPKNSWGEFMIGVKAPGGVFGAGLGIGIKRLIIPSVAVGFGGPEGINFSLGDEARLSRDRRIELRAFAYWTYAAGSHDDSDPGYSTAIGTSQMIKAGGVFVVSVSEIRIAVRAGYSWFRVMPEETDERPSGTSTTSAASDPYFRDGPLIGLGLEIPFRSM